MNKKILLLGSVGFLSISLVGAVFVANNNGIVFTKANEPYSCELPSGYHEISDVVQYLIDSGSSGEIANPYTFRATVTRKCENDLFVQRVNQVTGYLDAIKVTGSFAGDIDEGNVIDISGGFLSYDVEQPKVRISDSSQCQVAYAVNPTGYGPKYYHSHSEFLNAEDYYCIETRYSRLMNFSYMKPISYDQTTIAETDYICFTLQDFYSYQKIDVLLSDTVNYGEAVDTFQNAISNQRAISLNCYLTNFHGSDLFLSTKPSDIALSDNYIDTNVVSQGYSSTIYWNYNYSRAALSTYELVGKGDVRYVNFYEFFTDAMIDAYGSGIAAYVEMAKSMYEGSLEDYLYYCPYIRDTYGVDQAFIINPNADTITVIDNAGFYDYFTTSYNEDETEYARYLVTGAESDFCKFNYHDSKVHESGHNVTYDLGHYGLDIVKDKNDDMFIPASIAIDIISINAGWPMAFNGKDFYSIYAMFGGEDNNLISQYYYDSPYCAISTRSAEMADFAYKELAFAIETFYGLSGDRIPPYAGFDALVNALGYKEDLQSTDTDTFETALANFGATWLCDGHAYYYGPSPYGAADFVSYWNVGHDFSNGRNPRVSKLDADFDEILSYRNNEHKTVGLEIVDNTAIIRFDQFVKYRGGSSADYDVDSASYSTLHGIGTDLLYRKAFNEIELHPEIEQVVIDLTNNGGGEIDVIPFLMAYVYSDPYIINKNGLTGEIIEPHYYVDINYDGVVDEHDTYQGQYDFYLLTSNASFSCGTMLPTVIKDSGSMTIIGETSGGGECMVGMLSAAGGALFRNSSVYHSGTYDGEFHGNDSGIVPDRAFPREHFFDTEYLVRFLNGTL